MTNVRLIRKPFEGTFNNLVDDLFADLPALFKNDFNNFERKGSVPVNVKESVNGYTLEVVAPGFEKTDFKVHLENNLLTISADKKTESVEKQEGQSAVKEIRREYSYQGFKRSFTIDDKIDATKIEASYINGVLRLNLPKKEAVKEQTKEISIQ
ncbi:MAG: Hsp20/alpha crystallin family protein [Bacteroidetes bacterium]|nr:Hsp20/alpha crystallin family protein [Bacteroidota bacterium]